MPEVTRINAMTRREFAVGFDLLERPVLISGGCENFRACSTWGPAQLTARLGTVEIDYKQSLSHRHPDFAAPTLKEAFRRGHGTIAELIEWVTRGPEAERSHRLFTGDERYLLRKRDGVVDVDAALATLLDDVAVPPLFDPERLYTVWAWLSGAGVRTWLHYDNNGCHNLNAQITGRKRCVLYPPSALGKMRPFPLGGGNPAHNCSSIDVEVGGALSDVEGYTADLEAGDLLFIPAWWFHTFEHLGEFNTNVNFWYKPERPSHNAVAARQALLDAAARTLSPPTAEQAETLRKLDEALLGA
jgi:hypothetical protein